MLKGRALAAGLALASLLLPAVALPQADAAERVDLGASSEVVDGQRDEWRERLQSAREEVAAARARHGIARDTYSRMRHRRNERGEAKAEIMQELRDAEANLATAEATLRELIEDALSAGVPPGWLRVDRPESPAAPQAGSAP